MGAPTGGERFRFRPTRYTVAAPFVALAAFAAMAAVSWSTKWLFALDLAIVFWGFYPVTARFACWMDLDGETLVCRSLVRRHVVPLASLTSVTPGWRLPFWKWDPLRYEVRWQGGRILVPSVRGTYDFLRRLGERRPDLGIDESFRSRRAESSLAGRSAFVSEPGASG